MRAVVRAEASGSHLTIAIRRDLESEFDYASRLAASLRSMSPSEGTSGPSRPRETWPPRLLGTGSHPGSSGSMATRGNFESRSAVVGYQRRIGGRASGPSSQRREFLVTLAGN